VDLKQVCSGIRFEWPKDYDVIGSMVLAYLLLYSPMEENHIPFFLFCCSRAIGFLPVLSGILQNDFYNYRHLASLVECQAQRMASSSLNGWID